jgi:hypothetical protein
MTNAVTRPHAPMTVARLREALGEHFGRVEVRTYFQKLREAGLLPQGKGGKGDDASAQLTVEQAAMTLIALGSGARATDAPAEAKRKANFRLAGIEKIEVSNKAFVTRVEAVKGVTVYALLGCLMGVIDAGRGGLFDYGPGELVIGRHDAWLGRGKRLRDDELPEKRFYFVEMGDVPTPLVVRETRISGEIILKICSLFPPLAPFSVSDEEMGDELVGANRRLVKVFGGAG